MMRSKRIVLTAFIFFLVAMWPTIGVLADMSPVHYAGWGLSQASRDPGTVSDAVANGLYLVLLVRQMGGDLQGIV
jgi:hypothetical protein